MSYYIEKREGKRKTSYRAQVIVKEQGRILHREQKTFSARRDATSWGATRDKILKKALDDGPEHFAEATGQGGDQTIGELILRYQDEFSKRYGRTVGKDLGLLARSNLAQIPIKRLRSGDIVRHIQTRLDGGISPSTASNDLTRLHSVLETAWAAWNVPGDYMEEAAKARTLCRKQRMVAKAQQRTRLATEDELRRLITYFDESTRSTIPMADIVRFAFYSARRQDEITQLRWDDCKERGNELIGIVPRLKDPSGQRMNVEFRFTPEAWDIAQRQNRTDERIFPYNSKSIGTAFTRACKVLGIEGLRFHDLRHNACTRLFKLGYQVHEVPLVSLHRSWVTLKRYSNLEAEEIPTVCP